MILHRIIPILIACSCLTRPALAQELSPSPATIESSSKARHTQDFSETVVPISSWKIIPSVKLGESGKPVPALGIDATFGTGFCLDDACHFIVTNYHVAMGARPHKVKGEKITKRSFATGPDDRRATPNNMG